MSDSINDFQEHLRRLRMREPGAVESFVSTYGPYLQRSIRIRIRRASLQPLVDSVDVCQSVFASFLLRLSAGEYEIDSQEGMRKLLYGIAKNKFLMIQRREQTKKRCRKLTQSLSTMDEVEADRTGLSVTRFDNLDLLNSVAQRFMPDERELFELRSTGLTWSDIADRTGESPELLRKRLSRAVQRISVELGLEDDT